jgi:hypothetical protein
MFNINHSEQRLANTSIPWLISKKLTQEIRTHLEEKFGRQTDLERLQKRRSITTPVAVATVSFPMFVRIAPRKIGSTQAGWFFVVGPVAAPSGRRRSSAANDQPANSASAVRGTASKSFNLTMAS